MNLMYYLFRHIFGCFAVVLIISLIRINTAPAQTVLDRLEQQIRERVSQTPGPGYLGVLADDRKDRGRGVRITDVRAGSPAEKAGFRNQDLVTGLMGVRVRQLSEMTDILRLYQSDDVVEFDILRDGAPQKIKVILGRRPATPTPAAQTPEVIPLPPGEIMLSDPKLSKAPQVAAKIPLPPAMTGSTSDRETIEQLQKRIVELERRVAELEQVLSETQKKNK